MIKVYGHPRSGNNFLCELLALNFYPGKNLAGPKGKIGHWSNRVDGQSNPRALLFGGHHFPKNPYYPSVYIYRDGRDVALSLWRSPHFRHKDLAGISLSDFLRLKIGWHGSPGIRSIEPMWNIFEHWKMHLEAWRKTDVLKVRFEDLSENQAGQIGRIARFFGIGHKRKYHKVDRLVGWFPNEGRVGAWKNFFSKDDLEFFYAVVPRGFYGIYDEK
jgi:hypothetical protein